MSDQLELPFEDVPCNFAACPPVGIHRDIAFEVYASWRALNSGCLRQPTMKHIKAAFDGQLANDDTRSRKLGRAVHVRLLEPDVYAERVLIAEPCCAELKSGERKGRTCGKSGGFVVNGRWFCGTHKPDGAIVPLDYVSQDEAERIEAMAASLHGHPSIALLRSDGWSECSIVYESHGLKLKGRLDRFSESAKFVLDVKKMRVGFGAMDDCRKAIDDYGYLVQMAIYWKGVETLCGFRPRCLWLFVEDGAPFDVQLVEAEQWELDHAWQEVSGILSAFERCVADEYFPGYVKFDKAGAIISSHSGANPLWKAKLIQEGKL